MIAFCQFFIDDAHLFPIDLAAVALIFPVTVMMADAVLPHAHGLRIFLRHPRRLSSAWRGQNDMDSIFIQPIHHRIQPVKLKNTLCRFIRRPGKYAQSHHVDTCLFHKPNVLI